MMNVADDTIAAIATAAGGGVGIVRVSGPRAEAIARALVPSLPRAVPSHRLFLGTAQDPRSGEVLDEVLAVIMRAPRSYTGQDVAELHGHGGAASLAALLDAALAAGARPAGPGEFTRRAFVAGKIDLSQAEAVAGLIAASDARSRRAAQALMRGDLGRRVDDARRQIVATLAAIEGALDFPDEAAAEVAEGRGDPSTDIAMRARLGALAVALRADGKRFRRPLGVVPEVLLVGCVNAGKSSLLNALAGRECALVDEQPGTTRDLVEVEVALDESTRLRVIDTAGARDRPSTLEARGQALAEVRRDTADLALLVCDAARGWQGLDEALRVALEAAGLPVLIVLNKMDLPRGGEAPPGAPVAVSARTGDGLDRLRDEIRRALTLEEEPGLPIASARQARALEDAAGAIAEAAEVWSAAVEVAAVALRRALHHLGQVTGETVDEEVLDAIFARFCIGK